LHSHSPFGHIQPLSLLRGHPRLVALAALIALFPPMGVAIAGDLRAAGDLERGAAELEQVAALLGTSASDWSPDRIDAARRLQRDAARRIDGAAATLGADPMLGSVGALPGAGEQRRALLDLAGAAGDTAAATADLVQLADLYVGDRGDGPVGQRTLRLLAASGRPFADALTHLDRADAGMRAALAKPLPPPLAGRARDALSRLQPARRFAAAGSTAAVYLPGLLGAYGPRSYLLLFPNPNEIRPAGGFVGALGTLTVSGGMPAAIEVHGVQDLDRRFAQRFPVPVALGRRLVLGGNALDIGDAGWDPDFPTTATLSEEIYAASGGHAVDGTISVDPYAVAALLEITGPIRVEPYGTFTADTLFPMLNRIVNVDRGPESGKVALPRVAAALAQRVLAAQPAQWLAMMAVSADSARDRHLQLFLHDPAAERALSAARYDGAIVDPGPGADSLFVVDANIGGTKGDAYVERSMSARVEVDADGLSRHELVLRYSYPMQATDPTVPPGRDTAYRDYVRVYLPETSRLTGFSEVDERDQPSGGIEDESLDHGRRVFGMYFRLPRGATTEIHLFYSAPLDVRNGYRLSVQKQAGVVGRPVEIDLSAPGGVTRHALAGDRDEEVTARWG